MTAIFMNCPDCGGVLWFPIKAPPETFRVECLACGALIPISTKDDGEIVKQHAGTNKGGSSHG